MEVLSKIWGSVVDLYRDEKAIFYKDKSYTFGEVDEKSNYLANEIIIKTVKPLVGIMIDNSVEYVISLIATIKAGKGFVPIDMEYPSARKEAIIDECDLDLILCRTQLGEDIFIDIKEISLKDYNNAMINADSTIAYVLYTSGTTGKPKGIMISPESLINLIEWFGMCFEIDKNSRIAQLAKVTFDVSIEEIFGCLFNGGKLFIPDPNIKTNKVDMRKFIQQNSINLLQGVPLMIKEYFQNQEKIECLKTIICGGDVLSEELKNQILQQGYVLYNNYGPTETTVDSLSCKCSLDECVHLGNSVSGSEYFVLNKDNEVVVDGEVGELCISGVNLAIGYVRKEDNQGRFVYFRGKRIYRTGDLVKKENEKIIFIGREDSQVKIFGHRVELGEIEYVFMKTMEISLCRAVVVQGERIVVFYESDKDVDCDLTLKKLKEHLPQYMLPNELVRYEQLPATAHEKIDQKKLLDNYNLKIKKNNSNQKEMNDVEKKVAEIVADVVELDCREIDFGMNIMEMGINSINFVSILVELEDEFDIEFDDENLTITAFSTLANIVSYLEKLMRRD